MYKVFSKAPIFTFLETSAIDPMYNSISEEHLNILKKHVEENKIVLTTSPVVIYEVFSHIKKELNSRYEQMLKNLQSKEFSLLKRSKKSEYKFMNKSYDVDKMIKISCHEFEKILKNLNVEILKDNRISISKLLDMYFNSVPPFGDKQKKAEFPDAIIYLTLKKFAEEDSKIHVITNDYDWQRIQQEDHNFVVHKSIKEYLDYLQQDGELYNAVRTFLNQKDTKAKIITHFKHTIDGLEFRVKGIEYDGDAICSGYDYEDVEKIEIYDYDYIIDTFEDVSMIDGSYIAQVTILCSAKIDMKCTYLDEEDSIWDSEEKEYIDKQYKEIIETHEIDFPMRILIKCIKDDSFEIIKYKMIDVDYDILQLDNATRIRRSTAKNFDAYKFRVLRSFNCPYCGNKIHVDLISGDTECISSDERSMGLEKEYDIDVVDECNNCNKTFHITGHVWEYPEGAFNYEDKIKISKCE